MNGAVSHVCCTQMISILARSASEEHNRIPRLRFGLLSLVSLLSASSICRLLGYSILAWSIMTDAVRAEERIALPLLESLRKAGVDGKYRMLLHQIKVPEDAETYGDFRDLGLSQPHTQAKVKELPVGHWVYVYPYWYIWRDLVSQPAPKRGYGPEQVIGPPDTPQAGDVPTAWASQTADNSDEWLMVEYAEPVAPSALLIHESFNPGAVNRVTAFRLDGTEVEVWKGTDPTPVGSGQGISEIPLKTSFKANRFRIHLDSKAVAGWNEIDAVALRDLSGKSQWASAAEASSTYATLAGGAPGGVMVGGGMPMRAAAIQGQIVVIQAAPLNVVPGGAFPLPVAQAPPVAPVRDEKDERIRKLEKEVQDLKKAVKELQDKLKKN